LILTLIYFSMLLKRCIPSSYLLTLVLLVWNSTGFSQNINEPTEKFEKKILAKGLKDPWSVIYGPDNHLWITESKGYKILRVNPADGRIDTVADLNVERNFPRYDNLPDSLQEGKPWPQGGLMGMALHPDLLKDNPYVYVAFVYDYEGKEREGDGRNPQDQGFHFKTKVVRYTYLPSGNTLADPQIICDSIPGSNDHNGGRLYIAKTGGEEFLFYSVGDMGAGQYSNAARTNHAQGVDFYEGKVLRFRTEPLNDNNWIPKDNPFGPGNAVWSLGHRNPQGLTSLSLNGEEILFSSEHGPFSDDEINIIKKGVNYGHPLIIGYADGNYDGLSAAATDADSLPGHWNTTYPLIKSEVENAQKLSPYQDPLWSFNPTANALLKPIAEQLRQGAKESPEWESIAPSGMTSYAHGAIPSWENSLLITSLKNGSLIRLQLDKQGTKVLERKDYFKGNSRYRDVAVSSDGKKIYLITDLSTITSGPTEDNPESTDDRGALIEYSFVK
jgi:PQQ-dependent dehydrogenase (s-GDH family)